LGIARARLLPLGLLLLSAAGLLAVGAGGLWRSVRAAEARAAQLAGAEVGRVAEAMRAALVDPRVMDAVSARRFGLREGALVVPPAVGWIEAAPAPERADAARGEEARLALTAFARREAEGGDAADLGRDLRALVEASGDAPGSDAAVLLAATWFAHRHYDHAGRAGMLSRLRALVLARAGERASSEFLDDGQVASFALLASQAEQDGPARAETGDAAALRAAGNEDLLVDTLPAIAASVGRLDPPHAAAVLARLGEVGTAQELLRHLRAHVDDVQAERRALAAVAAHVGEFAHARAPAVVVHGDDLLTYRPASDGGGAGWVAPARALLAHVFAATQPSPAVGLSFTSPLPREASAVVAGVAGVVPAAAPSVQPPWLFAALVAALGLLFSGALWSTLRGLREQARAQQAHSEFLTSVTHELKTPLASMRLFAELLAEGRVTGPAQRDEYHRLLARETARLSALVENVLDLGRTERGERGYDVQDLDAASLVAEVHALFAPVAAHSGVRVELVAQADSAGGPRHGGHDLDVASGRLWVRGDRAALTQALLNVLGNALAHGCLAARTGTGGGRSATPADVGAPGAAPQTPPSDTPEVRLTLAADARFVSVGVRDHGPGVPVAEHEAIFARFRRGGGHATGRVPGLGLGLHLSRAILRAHGGDLVCRTPADGQGGAEFVFSLPRVLTDSAPGCKGRESSHGTRIRSATSFGMDVPLP